MPSRPPGGDRPDRLLSVGQLAEYLNVSEAWIRERILNRTLAYTKIGKHVRFTPEQVDQRRRQRSRRGVSELVPPYNAALTGH